MKWILIALIMTPSGQQKAAVGEYRTEFTCERARDQYMLRSRERNVVARCYEKHERGGLR